MWEDRESTVLRTLGIRRWTDGMEWKRGINRNVSVYMYILLRVIIHFRFQGFKYYEQRYYCDQNNGLFYRSSAR